MGEILFIGLKMLWGDMWNERVRLGKDKSAWWKECALELAGGDGCDVVDLFGDVNDRLLVELVLIDLVGGLTFMNLVYDSG